MTPQSLLSFLRQLLLFLLDAFLENDFIIDGVLLLIDFNANIVKARWLTLEMGAFAKFNELSR